MPRFPSPFDSLMLLTCDLGCTSNLSEIHLEMLMFCLTGMSPKVAVKDLLVSKKSELYLDRINWIVHCFLSHGFLGCQCISLQC